MDLKIGAVIKFNKYINNKQAISCSGQITGQKKADEFYIATDKHCLDGAPKSIGAVVMRAYLNIEQNGTITAAVIDTQKEMITNNFPNEGEKVKIRTSKGLSVPLSVAGVVKLSGVEGFVMPHKPGDILSGDSGAPCVNDKGETVGRLYGVLELDENNPPLKPGLYIFCSR